MAEQVNPNAAELVEKVMEKRDWNGTPLQNMAGLLDAAEELEQAQKVIQAQREALQQTREELENDTVDMDSGVVDLAMAAVGSTGVSAKDMDKIEDGLSQAEGEIGAAREELEAKVDAIKSRFQDIKINVVEMPRKADGSRYFKGQDMQEGSQFITDSLLGAADRLMDTIIKNDAKDDTPEAAPSTVEPSGVSLEGNDYKLSGVTSNFTSDLGAPTPEDGEDEMIEVSVDAPLEAEGPDQEAEFESDKPENTEEEFEGPTPQQQEEDAEPAPTSKFVQQEFDEEEEEKEDVYDPDAFDNGYNGFLKIMAAFGGGSPNAVHDVLEKAFNNKFYDRIAELENPDGTPSGEKAITFKGRDVHIQYAGGGRIKIGPDANDPDKLKIGFYGKKDQFTQDVANDLVKLQVSRNAPVPFKLNGSREQKKMMWMAAKYSNMPVDQNSFKPSREDMADYLKYKDKMDTLEASIEGADINEPEATAQNEASAPEAAENSRDMKVNALVAGLLKTEQSAAEAGDQATQVKAKVAYNELVKIDPESGENLGEQDGLTEEKLDAMYNAMVNSDISENDVLSTKGLDSILSAAGVSDQDIESINSLNSPAHKALASVSNIAQQAMAHGDLAAGLKAAEIHETVVKMAQTEGKDKKLSQVAKALANKNPQQALKNGLKSVGKGNRSKQIDKDVKAVVEQLSGLAQAGMQSDDAMLAAKGKYVGEVFAEIVQSVHPKQAFDVISDMSDAIGKHDLNSADLNEVFNDAFAAAGISVEDGALDQAIKEKYGIEDQKNEAEASPAAAAASMASALASKKMEAALADDTPSDPSERLALAEEMRKEMIALKGYKPEKSFKGNSAEQREAREMAQLDKDAGLSALGQAVSKLEQFDQDMAKKDVAIMKQKFEQGKGEDFCNRNFGGLKDVLNGTFIRTESSKPVESSHRRHMVPPKIKIGGGVNP
jgi:hypothetical protein